jgi:hypothetical protein
MLLIVSPLSIQRRWIYFEAGAAYVKGIPVVPVCVNGIKIADLTPPLSLLQALDITEENSAQKLLEMIAKRANLRPPKYVDELVLPAQHYAVAMPPAAPSAPDPLEVPLTKRQARQMMRAIPPEQAKSLSELFTMASLHHFDGWVSEPESVLRSVEKTFSNPSVLTEPEAKEMIKEARGAYEAFKPDEETESYLTGYQHVRAVLAPVLKVIPSDGECIEKILDYPPEVVAPFLVDAYFSNKWPGSVKNLLINIFIEEDLGKAALPIFEDIVLKNEPRQHQFRGVVSGARRALGDKFDDWYKNIRGISYPEDLRRAEEKEAREEEMRVRRYEEERRYYEAMERRNAEKQGNEEGAPAE